MTGVKVKGYYVMMLVLEVKGVCCVENYGGCIRFGMGFVVVVFVEDFVNGNKK